MLGSILELRLFVKDVMIESERGTRMEHKYEYPKEFVLTNKEIKKVEKKMTYYLEIFLFGFVSGLLLFCIIIDVLLIKQLLPYIQ